MYLEKELLKWYTLYSNNFILMCLRLDKFYTATRLGVNSVTRTEFSSYMLKIKSGSIIEWQCSVFCIPIKLLASTPA